MERSLLFCFFLAGLLSCKEATTSVNKFSDPTHIKIADLQDRRALDSLFGFFQHEDSRYRKDAVLAFASIQDSSAVTRIGALLHDSDTAVRRAAAFALGQTPSAESARLLKDAASKEKETSVLNEILESYGKATRQWTAPVTLTDNTQRGEAWSLYRAGLNNAVAQSLNAKAATFLSNQDEKTRVAAAHFFARSAQNFNNILPVIAMATNDVSPDVRMAAAFSLRKITTDSSFIVIEKTLKDKDPRVRVNAVKALQSFPFEKSKDVLLRMLNDKNINVGIAASEVIRDKGTDQFWVDIANRAGSEKNWRIQANLYQAVVRVKDNKPIIDEIKGLYRESTNPYQQASLITALQETTSTLDFIEQELLKADTPVVRSSAAAALVAINKSRKFPASQKPQMAARYKMAIGTGDPSVIGTIAGALSDSILGYRSIINDISFLMEARKKLSLPKDNEALQPLEAAIAHFQKKKLSPVRNQFNHPIDWALVKTIPKDQVAIIRTAKGNVTMRLLVEEAPGSVANFVTLVKQKYFDSKLFHRVVPNFVVQAGCNRGDGSGSEDYSIRSEFSERRYTTGSVGMASAGKDTEGTQWFITHSPTPHLDGRYTIFAVVEDGMDVVPRIEVGDQILSVTLKEAQVK
jgi:cyclophilin family peptidyl-prolyl cis-trans isomerase/HEAT repeat protein